MRAYLARLGVLVSAGVGAAGLLAALSIFLPINLGAPIRSVFAAAGAILVMTALLRATRGAQQPPTE